MKGKLLFRVIKHTRNDQPPINHIPSLSETLLSLSKPIGLLLLRCHLSLLKPVGAFPNSDSLSMRGRGSDALGCQCWILATLVCMWGGGGGVWGGGLLAGSHQVRLCECTWVVLLRSRVCSGAKRGY